MAETKRTTAMKLTEWKEMYADNAEFVEYCENELAKLEKKAVKTKERAAEKRAAGSELRAVVESLLTEEFQTAEAILGQIEDPEGELSKQKITFQLSELVRYEKACKKEITVDGKKRMHYALPTAADAE